MTTLFMIMAVSGVGMLLLGFVFDDFLDGVLDAVDVDTGGVLSVPVLGAFLGAFGIGGLLAGEATDGQLLSSLVGAAVGGVLLGYVALRLSRAFIDMPTDPTLTSREYMGQIGKVVTPIAGGRGEIMMRAGGAPMKLTAHADGDIDNGAEVVVIEVMSSTAVRVIPFTEILEEPSP